MTGERILVTGAAGFAGRHLLAALPRDACVEAWRRRAPAPGEPAPAGRWVSVDLLDRAEVERACAEARPTVVFHLAAAAQVASSWGHVRRTLAVNVRGTHHLLGALARHAPDARVVVAGSGAIYRSSDAMLDEASAVNPGSPYGVSKLAQEMLALRAAENDGRHAVVARAFNHIGPGQSAEYVASSVARQIALAELGRQEPRLLVGNLEARRDFTDVRDTVRAYILLAARAPRGGTYNVCSGRAVKVGDLVQALVSRASVPIAVEADPAKLRPVDTPVVVGSFARLARDTGWNPQIPLERTLDDLLAWWRAGAAAGRV